MNMIKIAVKLHLKNVTIAVVTVVCIALYVQTRNKNNDLLICRNKQEFQQNER